MDQSEDQNVPKGAIPIELPDEVLPNQKPSKFFDIPKDVIDSFSAYMQVVVSRSDTKKHQELDIKKILKNAENMFREGPRYHDDLWIQHTASSLREIIDFLDIVGEDFYKAHSSIPAYSTNQTIKEGLDKVVLIRSYLSDIVHFVPGNRLGIIQRLYPNDIYSTMRIEKFFREEAETFEKVCIDLVYIINNIFTKYCIGIVVEDVKTKE